MSKKWQKTTISIQSKVSEDTNRKRSYNNVAKEASDEKILVFADTIELLTGQQTSAVTLTTVEDLDNEKTED